MIAARGQQIDTLPGAVYVAPVPELDEVTLRGMRFHALVGVLPHEAEFAQPLEVDVSVGVRPGAAISSPCVRARSLLSTSIVWCAGCGAGASRS